MDAGGVSVLGLCYFTGDMAAAAEAVTALLPRGGAVFTPNAEIAYRAYRDKEFCGILKGADILLPDGQGIVLGARMKGRRLCRLPGVEMGEALCKTGLPLFLLGGKPAVAEAAAERLSRAFGACIVGAADGYFSPDEEAALLRRIRESGAMLLFVCLGSPRQEEWILRNRTALSGIVALGLGGSIDIYAGRKKRAPRVFRRLGLEWLYRLLREPRRFFRIWALPRFLWAAWRNKGE